MKKSLNMSVKVIPIVVGRLKTVSENVENELEECKIWGRIETIAKNRNHYC